jgi:hypothetical protein
VRTTRIVILGAATAKPEQAGDPAQDLSEGRKNMERFAQLSRCFPTSFTSLTSFEK